MTTPLEAALAQLSVHYFRFASCLEIGDNQVLDLETLIESLPQAIAQSKAMFKLADDRHAAQLWLFSLIGSVAAPSVTTMVLGPVIPHLDLKSGTLFEQEQGNGYWFGFRPKQEAESYQEAGRQLGESVAPIITTICDLTSMRPAPLWAVVADGVVQPAMAAGNEEFEQLQAIDIAHGLHAGVQEMAPVKVPSLRIEQIVDGQLLPLSPGEEPDFVLAHRSSCCMIFHSPEAGLCASCPHQPKEERLAKLIAVAGGF